MSAPMFLTLNEVVERYRGQIGGGTLRNWRSMRIGPSFIKIGKAVLYPLEQLDRSQFCPVAIAAEILCTRWTIVVLREISLTLSPMTCKRAAAAGRRSCRQHRSAQPRAADGRAAACDGKTARFVAS
jgi:hypothetical protein